MDSASWKTTCAALICGAGLLGCREVAAQSLGGSPGTGAVSLGAPATSGGLPTSSAMAPATTVVPSATASGSSTQGGVFGSPLAAPLLYNSMLQASQPQSQANGFYGPTGLGTTQLGLMLLANQRAGGLGSGRISGTRTDPRPREATSTSADDSKRRTPARPGGLASRYFNRVGPHSPYPKNYFNRRTRFFP
jgi:hypothetical protein